MKSMAQPTAHTRRIASAAVAIAICLSWPRLHADTLRYIFAPEPKAHTLHVTIEWQTEGAGPSTLSISRQWASVHNPARFIRDVSVEGGTLQPAREAQPSHWQIEHDPGALIQFEYTVDAGRSSFDWEDRYLPIVAHEFFHGIGETFLITPDGSHGAFDVAIEWKLSEDWNDAACSLGHGTSIAFRAHPMTMRQSVFLAGSLEVAGADAEGQPLSLNDSDEPVFLTAASHNLFRFKATQLARVASRILEAQRKFMADEQLPPFLITAIPVGDPLTAGSTRFGGTGLHQSVALFLPPVCPMDDRIIMLIAHEMFHHWNGRVLARVEPEELVYWFSEGLTDYYAMRVLLDRFPDMHEWLADWLNGRISAYHGNPAIHATNEEIRARFWSGEEPYRDIPYARGLMLGIRWHHLARENGVEDGLDALMRELMRRARERDYGVANQTLREIGIETLGEWFGEDFDRYANGAETIPLEEDFMQPWFDGSMSGESSAFDLGFDWARSQPTKTVRGLKPGSAAAEAGLQEGDLLVGWSLTTGDANQPVELTVQRGGRVFNISYMPTARVSGGGGIPRFRVASD